MKYTFKQFNAYAALTEQERTDDKFAEIFGLEPLDEGVVDDIAQAVGGAVGTVAKAIGYKSTADKAREKIADASAKRADAKKKMDAKLAKIKSFDDRAKALRTKMSTADAAIAKDRAQLMKKSVGKYTDSNFAKDLLAQQNEEAISILKSIAEGEIGVADFIAEAKAAEKVYVIIKKRDRDDKAFKSRGTLEELIKIFAYPLETGASYQNEKGAKKVNRQPKTIKALITSLENAANNAAANGYSGVTFDFEEAKDDLKENLAEAKNVVLKDQTPEQWKKLFKKINKDCDEDEQVPLTDAGYYADQIVILVGNQGDKISRKDAKAIAKQLAEAATQNAIADILQILSDEVIEEFGLQEGQDNTLNGLIVEEIEQFLG